MIQFKKLICMLEQVGQRRRVRRTPISDSRGTIPLERSLVPVRVQDPYRDI